jgi:hypothetical protein
MLTAYAISKKILLLLFLNSLLAATLAIVKKKVKKY